MIPKKDWPDPESLKGYVKRHESRKPSDYMDVIVELAQWIDDYHQEREREREEDARL